MVQARIAVDAAAIRVAAASRKGSVTFSSELLFTTSGPLDRF
jgi:hypothetical protein